MKEKTMQRQDIKTMIDRLDQLEVYEADEKNIYDTINSAIYMLKELGNLVHDLRLDNESLKQEILHLEAMIED